MKRIKLLLSILACISCLVGCSNQQGNTVDTTVWNDYNGAYDRVLNIQTQIVDTIGQFTNEEYFDLDNYWEQTDFFCLNFHPIDTSSIEKTYYYNEEQCDWATTLELLTNAWGEDVDLNYLTYTHTSPHHYQYSFTGYEDVPYTTRENPYGERVRISTYDTNNDWMQTISKFKLMNEDWVYDDLFEYARIPNGAIFQTGTERILVYFVDDWKPITMPVLKTREVEKTDKNGNTVTVTEQYIKEIEMEEYCGRVIKELYYSKLSDNVRPCYINDEYEHIKDLDFEDLKEYNIERTQTVLTDVSWDGIYERRYSDKDSLFPVIDTINRDWVITDDELYQDVVIYQNGNLYIELLNDLSDKIETVNVDKNLKVTTGQKELPEIETFDYDKYYKEKETEYLENKGW